MDTLLSSGLRRASCFVDLFCNCLACVVVDGLRKFYECGEDYETWKTRGGACLDEYLFSKYIHKGLKD